MPEAVLTVGGVELGGWTSVRVSKGLDCLSGTFDLALSAKFQGQGQAYRFSANSRCTVHLDGELAITGWVDEVTASYDDSSHNLSVRGRDLTGDLVDCSHVAKANSNAFNGLDLLDIATMVCKPFGIIAMAEVDVGAPFPVVKTNEGESVFALLDRLAKARQVMPISPGDGTLLFTRAGTRQSAGTIELGGNVKSGETQQSNMERFSEYRVKGQGTSAQFFQEPGQAAVPAHPAQMSAAEYQARQDAQIRAAGRATDSAIGRYRPLVIVADTAASPDKMQAMATYQAMIRAGQSRQLSYTVSGWGPQGGGLWEINTLVRVVDAFFGVDDLKLIQSVDFSQDDRGGSITGLTLVDPEAYAPDPTATAAAGDITGFFD